MHDYDIALKLLLQWPAEQTIRGLSGDAVSTWLNVEFSDVKNSRVDLLGQTQNGRLLHIEMQSGNDSLMPLRMAEYYLQVYRHFKQFPHQVVLYVGEAPVRMPRELVGDRLSFSYDLVDIRDLDGSQLLSSSSVGDNVIAVLARWDDYRDVVRRIVSRVAELPAGRRERALRVLLILSGLRKLEETVELEVSRVPILNDILDHKVLGREFKRGLKQGIDQGLNEGLKQGINQGLNEGLKQGLDEGLQLGELTVLRRQIEHRFGKLPKWAEESLSKRSAPELEALAVKALDATNIEDLLS